jgi:DnaJ family protein C protein 3
MIVHLSVWALAATILSSNSLVLALRASDIPPDTPISSLLASANAHLAKGETNDALTYYDVAISRDPNNYLTYFKRGATYLSLGRTVQATHDFDKVLEIKPGFEGALVQRAKIKAKNGEWDAAKKDFITHGNSEVDLAQLHWQLLQRRVETGRNVLHNPASQSWSPASFCHCGRLELIVDLSGVKSRKV